MHKQRKALSFSALAVSLALLVTACGGAGKENQNSTNASTTVAQATATSAPADPFEKYEKPVELTACRVLVPSFMKFDEGENENNNWWTRTLQEQLGIKLNFAWTAPNWGDPLEQKINVAMATDDLPDIIPIYTSYFMKLAKAGKLADLTDAYNKYASPYLKEVMALEDSAGYKAGVVNGKLYGLGDAGGLKSSIQMVWLREDWLKKMNLQPPKTFDELKKIAKAFVENDPDRNGKNDTTGLTAHKLLFSGTGDMHGFFNMFNAYPDTWIEKDGKLVYGGIQPEIKDALKELAQWYKEGLLAKDFAIKDTNKEIVQDVASGKTGMIIGGDRFPNGGSGRDFKKNFPDADWICVPMPSRDGKPVKVRTAPKVGDFFMINAKAKNPEALIKMANLYLQCGSLDNQPKWLTTNEHNTTKGGNPSFWNMPVRISDPRVEWASAQKTRDAVKANDPSKLTTTGQKQMFDQMKSWTTEGKNGKQFDLNWSIYKIFWFEGGAELSDKTIKAGNVMVNRNYGYETDAMAKNGTSWKNKYEEHYIKAIVSGNVDQEFDNFVKYFNANGGETAVKEINEWYAERNKKK